MNKHNYIPIVRGGVRVAVVDVPDEHYEWFHTLFTEATGSLNPVINELVAEHRVDGDGVWHDQRNVKRVMQFRLDAASEDVMGLTGIEA